MHAEANVQPQSLPPHINVGDRVILFDGVCKLCNVWARFIIKYDKKHHFKLCSVQSSQGGDILAYFNYPTDVYDTMLLVTNNHCVDKSDAFFSIVTTLGFPFKTLSIFSLLPASFRHWLYDVIARNRYRLFGQYDHCILPSPDHKNRFLHD